MTRGLPPLNSLRAFESAARRLSFTRAAEELCVTQAAISHHVKILEEHLGFRLFRRLNNSLVLTENGEAYLPSVRQAFDLLSDGTEAVQGQSDVQVLTISVLPNFALRWLVPRLADFQQANPHLNVRLLSSYRGTDFLREDIDAAIRLGADWPDINSDLLFGSDMFPVCSPTLLDNSPLATPHDLARHTLLHVWPSPDDWPLWLAAAQAPEIAADRGPSFDSYALSTEAAVHRCGVAMAPAAFVEDDLEEGRLVAPFTVRLSRDKAWHFLWSRSRSSRKISLFRSWLLARAELTRRAVEQPAALAQRPW